MTPMSERQRATLRWLAWLQSKGKKPNPDQRLSVPSMSIYDALERRGYVTIVKNGHMSLSTGRTTFNEYDVTITEAGLQAVAGEEQS